MINAGITFSGYDEFIKFNEKITQEAFDKIHEEIINDTVSLIRQRAPVDTGRLIDAITWIRVNTNQWKIIVGVDYAVYMEYGTRYFPVGTTNSPRIRTSASGKMCYHPFVRPSFWEMNKLFPQYIERILFSKGI